MKIFLSLFLSLFCLSTYAGEVRVFAAASLSQALKDVAELYEEQRPTTNIVLVFGATSTLAKQIERGADADFFFSADLDWMDFLKNKSRLQNDSIRSLLGNELVLIAPKSFQVKFFAFPKFDFAASFKGYLCTGEMSSVPVGKYAKQSLETLKWFDHLKGRIVGTDNTRSALALVERNECQMGIVYKTDALMSTKVKVVGQFPASTHEPIVYPIALTTTGAKNRDALNFEQFILTNPKAKAIFRKYGFQVL